MSFAGPLAEQAHGGDQSGQVLARLDRAYREDIRTVESAPPAHRCEHGGIVHRPEDRIGGRQEHGRLFRRDTQQRDGVLARVLRVGKHQRCGSHGPGHRRGEESDQAGVVRLRIAQEREIVDRDHPFGA